MAQSLAKIHVHLIFSTKNRQSWLAAEWQTDLWAYLAGAVNGTGCFANRVGGHTDHCHLLFELNRTKAVSNIVGEIKVESSKWIKREKNVREFEWQAGYGAFSVSASGVSGVETYIDNQGEHHRSMSFQDEFRMFLKKYQVAYDEQYVWD